MYTLKDNDVISEVMCGNNFEYILKDSSQFVNTDYKVLQSQNNGIFIKCMKMTRNGLVDLYYVTDEYRPMSSMLVGISPDTLINVIINLFASVIEVRNNGFLACQCIDLSWDKIFVEQNTLKVKLVYLPLSVRAFDSYAEFESELRSSIVKLADKVITSSNARLDQFVQDLCNGSMSLEDVYNKSRGAETAPIVRSEERSQMMPGTSANGSIKLVAMNAPSHFELVIDRDDAVIGKKTNEAVLIPTNQSRGITFLKTGVWIVVAVIVLGSLLFQDNLFSELSWTARVLLFVLALGVTFLGGKKEYVPSPMELQFFEDHLVLYLPKRYYSKHVTRMEINQMKYSEITKCVYKSKSQRIHLYGKGTSTWYNYKADGTIPQTPTQVRNCTAGLLYFNTKFAIDVDFKTEIEKHSPIQVIVENS